ncbi:MAG: hypothetical protein WCK28_15405 [Burkholderiales bacterium]
MARRTAVAGGVLLSGMLAAGPAPAAERTLTEFWPELDVFVKRDETTRLFLLAALTRAAETGTSTEGTLGVHLDWFPAGLPRPLLEVAPGLAERWSLWTRVGYQHLSAWNAAGRSENRLVAEATLRSEPLWLGLQFANRVRVDLRAVGDDTSWRFRNRTRIERTWPLRGDDGLVSGMLGGLPPGTLAAVTPYAMVEFFRDGPSGVWSRRFEQFGSEFELAGNRAIDLYLGRQDDLRGTGARLWIGGVALTLRY